jgi:hypothetical protein
MLWAMYPESIYKIVEVFPLFLVVELTSVI